MHEVLGRCLKELSRVVSNSGYLKQERTIKIPPQAFLEGFGLRAASNPPPVGIKKLIDPHEATLDAPCVPGNMASEGLGFTYTPTNCSCIHNPVYVGSLT